MHTSSPIPTTEWVGSTSPRSALDVGRWVDMRGLAEAVGVVVLRRFTVIKKIDVIRLRERSCR
jgi:hypothetical protein